MNALLFSNFLVVSVEHRSCKQSAFFFLLILTKKKFENRRKTKNKRKKNQLHRTMKRKKISSEMGRRPGVLEQRFWPESVCSGPDSLYDLAPFFCDFHRWKPSELIFTVSDSFILNLTARVWSAIIISGSDLYTFLCLSPLEVYYDVD